MRLLIAETLRALRERHGMTLDDIASALDITRSAAARIESKHANLTADSIGRQLDVIGATVADFCGELAHQHGEQASISTDEIEAFGRAFVEAFKRYRNL